MGRNKSHLWDHFKTIDCGQLFKTPRAQCKYCKKTVSNTSTNMRTHFENCEKVPRSVGRLPSDIIEAGTSIRIPISKTSRFYESSKLSHFIVEKISRKKKQMDEKFTLAMHATATHFIFFEHPLWHDFFSAMSKWEDPAPKKLGNELLDDIYKVTMQTVFVEIKSAQGGTFRIDGATDNLAKSRSNVILHTTTTLFIEYLKSDLKRENIESFVLLQT